MTARTTSSPPTRTTPSRLLRRCLSGRVGPGGLPLGLADPFGCGVPFGLPAGRNTGVRSEAGVVAGEVVFDIRPNSAPIERDEFQIAVQLQPRVQVVDPDRQQG